MAGVDNLIPTNQRSKDEVRDIGRAGGVASGVARRKKRTMQDIARRMLELPLNAKCGDVVEVVDIANSAGLNITVQDAILLAQVRKAIDGDKASAEFIRDTSGQKPTEQTQLSVTSEPLADFTTEELKSILEKDTK